MSDDQLQYGSGSGINELPPDRVSTQQLLIMVRDLRAEARVMRKLDREWREELTKELVEMRKDIRNLSSAFENGKTTIRVLKWLGAFTAAALALYEALKRIGV